MAISKCRSTKFRKRLLAESDVTLEKALKIGRLMENADRKWQDIRLQIAQAKEVVWLTL